MKKWTNKHNLPKEIVNAVTKDRYTDETEAPSDFSATTLIAPIQQTSLIRQNKDNLMVRDVVDDFWAFMGSIAHNVLEEAYREEEGSVVEERLYAEMLGKSISGKMDCYANGVIRDYKTTKAYKIMRGDYESWELQLNIYAWLCRQNGWRVDKLEVVAIVFNWNERDTYQKGYPQCPFVTIPLELWSDEKIQGYIEGRVQSLIAAEGLTASELAQRFPCSHKDMWSDVQDYAVIKHGSDRATRKFDNEADAIQYLRESKNPADYYIKERRTPRTRCLKYCDVCHLCDQHAQILRVEMGEEDGEESGPLLF